MDKYRRPEYPVGSMKTVPFTGGNITRLEKAQVPPGGYSRIQNMRGWHPGFEKRMGYSKANEDHFDSSHHDRVMSLYSFSKDRKGFGVGNDREKNFLVQHTDLGIVRAEWEPPGTSVDPWTYPIIAPSDQNEIPASYSDLDDMLLISTSWEQNRIWTGRYDPVRRFLKCRGDADQFFPEDVYDYLGLRNQPSDAHVGAQSIHGIRNYTTYKDAWFFKTETPINELHWELSSPNTQGGITNLIWQYWNGNTEQWANITYTDTTNELLNDGSWIGTAPSQLSRQIWERPRYLFGDYGIWYRIIEDGTGVQATVRLEGLETRQEEAAPIFNFWDTIELDIIEAQVEDSTNDTWDVYPASSIILSEFDSSDNSLYFSTDYPALGVYLDFGSTPHDPGAAITNVTVSYWDWTNGWTAISELVEGTNNFKESGWIWFWSENPILRDDATPEEVKLQFRNTLSPAYWYRIEITGGPVSENVVVGMTYAPFYPIEEYGTQGNVNCAWKDRAVWTFEKFPRDLYVSAKGRPQVLNGTDFNILEPGDGRFNRTVSVKKFYNEIIAWQKEEGTEGGCTTMFEGFNPSTQGKLILSTQIGSFSENSTIVIDGSLASTRRDSLKQTMAYWISHYGIYATDGAVVFRISDDIQNYFDPRFPECIRSGYEDLMWVGLDSTNLVLRFGLVSGTTDERCNIFPVYDLVDGTWSFDVYADEESGYPHPEGMSCWAEAENQTVDPEDVNAQLFALQYGGGNNGRWVYRHNVLYSKSDDFVAGLYEGYFNSYTSNVNFVNPHLAVDSSESTYASVTGPSTVGEITLDGHTLSDPSDAGQVLKVEIRLKIYNQSFSESTYWRGVYEGGMGSWQAISTTPGAEWTEWEDITNDSNSPGSGNWTWDDVEDLDLYVKASPGGGGTYFYLYKAEIRVSTSGAISGVLIDSYVDLEFNDVNLLSLTEFLVRIQANPGQTIKFTAYENGVKVEGDNPDGTYVRTQDKHITGDLMRQLRPLFDAEQTANITIRIQNDILQENLYLFDYGIKMNILGDVGDSE